MFSYFYVLFDHQYSFYYPLNMQFWIDHSSFFYFSRNNCLLVFTFFLQPGPKDENVRLKFKLTNQLILFLTVYYKGVSCNKACKTKIKLTIHSFLHHSKWLAFFLISSVHSVVFTHCTFSLNRNDLFLLANPIR